MQTHWIWIPEQIEIKNDVPVIAWFRREFELTQIPDTFTVWISADTRYKLFLNGTLIHFGPARGDGQVWFRDKVALAPYLKTGRNALAVEVLRYPLVNTGGNHGTPRTQTPGFYLESTAGEFGADENWDCKLSPVQIVAERNGFSPLMFMEKAVSRKEDAEWKLPFFHAQGWQKAVQYPAWGFPWACSPGNLLDRPIPSMKMEPKHLLGTVHDSDMVWDRLILGQGTVEIPAESNLHIELDAGELTCGLLSLRLMGGQGSKIRIVYAECYAQEQMHPGGRLPVKKDRTDWVNGHLSGYSDEYCVCGYGTEEKPETYEPYWFRTFRFIRLEIRTEEAMSICGLDYRETGCPLHCMTEASASDPDFDGIWEMSLRTMKRCMHETYMDCPYYEQLQYAMDTRSEILFTYAISSDDRLARQAIEAFRRSQREDGLMNAYAPYVIPNVIPSFSIFYILMVYDHMLYFGDKAFLRQQISAIDSILEYFHRHLDPMGIVGSIGGRNGSRFWSFIDWAEPWKANGGSPTAGIGGKPITMESFLYLYGLMHGAKICDFIGRRETAEEYRTRASMLRNAIQSHCRDENGIYLDGPGVPEYSQHCQVFAVLTDTAQNGSGLLASLKEPEKYAQCTVAMSFYLLRALEKAGMYEKTEAVWNIWRRMREKHLTTCAENELEERSDCHAWGSVLLYELPAVILGVRPSEPGYSGMEIDPAPGYLTYAHGKAATKWGEVTVSWQKEKDGTISGNYILPSLPAEVKVKAADGLRRIE